MCPREGPMDRALVFRHRAEVTSVRPLCGPCAREMSESGLEVLLLTEIRHANKGGDRPRPRGGRHQ